MTSQVDSVDNSNSPSNHAKIDKALRAWKDLLYAADRKQLDGVFWIMIPRTSGVFGPYRTAVMPPVSDGS